MNKVLEFLKLWMSSVAVITAIILVLLIFISIVVWSFPIANPFTWLLLRLVLSIGFIFACILTLFDIFEGL